MPEAPYVRMRKNILDVDAMLLKLIVRTYQSFSIVEEQDFIEFVEALNHKLIDTYSYNKIQNLLIDKVQDMRIAERKSKENPQITSATSQSPNDIALREVEIDLWRRRNLLIENRKANPKFI